MNNNSSQFSKENENSKKNFNKFDFITSEIAKNYIKKNILHIIFKQNPNLNILYMQFLYKKNTDFNPLSFDLSFSVTIDHNYPDSVPIVKSLNNFCFPTLFDNRNLIFSIINHNWVSNNDVVKPIEEIIIKIPQFVNRLMENTINKILVYYGDYKIDMIYDINEFLSNLEIDFFRINQYFNSKKQKDKEKNSKDRYIVLSDIYFLLFDPVPSSKNLAKLLFWGDIRQIVTCKSGNTSEANLILEWKNSDKVIQFQISFKNITTKVFLDKATRKILRLKDQYKIFQDDISKPGDDGIFSKVKDLNIENSNIDQILQLVKYKEELLEKNHSINLIRELMSLYQKIIEILSANEDGDFKIYLYKLHHMLEDKEIQQELEKENSVSQISTKNLFELSNSYHVDENHEDE